MNIAILGYGIEGESAYKYYRTKYPNANITAYDNSDTPKRIIPEDVQFFGGRKDFRGIHADLAIKTPAIPPWLVEVDGEVSTLAREFLKLCPATVIGVTGTKGKGTTASFIYSILKASGKGVWLVGNIGIGALDILNKVKKDDLVVFEMSSFQLWDLEISPHVAVLLGIEPEHLDVHKDMEDYVMAKANITKHQQAEDIVIYKKGNEYSEEIIKLSRAKKVAYPSLDAAYIKNDDFYYGEQKLCSTEAVIIPGRHNLDNACAAIAATWPWVKDGKIIEKGLQSFNGLPHRLKYVRTVRGVDFYDDSISTTPGSAIAAIKSFSKPKILILGGSGKGADYSSLVEEIKKSNVRHNLLIGKEAHTFENLFRDAKLSNYSNLGSNVSMKEIVHLAFSLSQDGDIVILSPSCASFDMFANYEDRGDQFNAAVNKL